MEKEGSVSPLLEPGDPAQVVGMGVGEQDIFQPIALQSP